MDELFSETHSLFTFAEEKIKLIEHLGNGLKFPAVNQLRYAGFHLFRAESASDPEKRNNELRKAKNHCQRAIYDAVEVGILYYLERFKVFQYDYRKECIFDVVLRYHEYRSLANKITNFISSITRDSISDHCNNRGDQYQLSTEYLNQLKEIDEVLQVSRDELNKKIRDRRTQIVLSLWSLILTIVGLIVSLVLHFL